jgi:hypothetical protein
VVFIKEVGALMAKIAVILLALLALGATGWRLLSMPSDLEIFAGKLLLFITLCLFFLAIRAIYYQAKQLVARNRKNY